MSVFRKILYGAGAAIMVGYIIFAAACLSDGHEESRVCQGISLHVSDSLDLDLVDYDMVLDLLKERNMDPTGKAMDEIDVAAIEELLSSHPLVAGVECYRTGGDMLRIRLSGKVPLVRVRSAYGQDFYVDSRGELLQNRSLAVDLPVATGYITSDYARGPLLDIVRAIESSEFWKAQVEQINISREGQVQLVPRVGDHLLILGSAENIPEKLDRLLDFYSKGLDRIGWNKYRTVSVAYEGQVVCKKR